MALFMDGPSNSQICHNCINSESEVVSALSGISLNHSIQDLLVPKRGREREVQWFSWKSVRLGIEGKLTC